MDKHILENLLRPLMLFVILFVVSFVFPLLLGVRVTTRMPGESLVGITHYVPGSRTSPASILTRPTRPEEASKAIVRLVQP
jgi:hypothetical protein